MRKSKFLNIKGAVLDNEGLKNFMEKIAASYDIGKFSNKDTYPMDRLNKNYLFIEKTYSLLNEHIKIGIDIYPAGEWLLDNFYIIEEAVKKIKKEMPLKKYIKLPGIANGSYEGFARIYLLASIIVGYRDNIIDDESLKQAISAYQRQKTLNMEEIWNLWIFLEIAIIENIRSVCEKIYSAQIQKYKVEEIIERVIKKRNKYKKLKYLSINNEVKYPFVEYMSYKLKMLGKSGTAYLRILEEEIKKIGISIDGAIKKEHFDIAMKKVLIGNGITSIREISRINFLVLFEEINGVEEILKKDPANKYLGMDFKTKAYYRSVIKDLADRTKISESYIASKALELALNNKEEKAHIGFYLIDEGYNKLLKSLNVSRKYYKKNEKTKAKMYIYSIYIVSVLFSILFGMLVFNKSKSLFYSIVISILSVVPISEIYIQLINYVLIKKVKPKLIPKMDFSKGIPKDYTSIVVIPTIINSSKKVKEFMYKLEVYYLANKSENLYFALLGDCTTSQNEKESFDKEIETTGQEEVDRLNEKYAKNKQPKFFFLYRNRTWNAGEKAYLGWERKRGLLNELNEFLVNGTNKFRYNTLAGEDLNIKYVITLDADTSLCLNTASLLIGSMAHILNKPKVTNGIVTKGHGIIEPRVGIDLDSSRKTFFSRIYSGNGGTDLYANAISDVYQDNFGEGIFCGKGIYDLKTFHEVLNKEIPENRVLSHDLLEGCYLRAGLATDIFLLDGCPTKYNSYITRLHRWIRGDFQIIDWLYPKITIKDGTRKQNPLNNLSKFKILDNLRRGLTPVFSLILILIGLLIKDHIVFGLGLFTVFSPSLLDLGNYIIFKKNEVNIAYRNIIKTISDLSASVLRGVLEFIFLPNKAIKTLDAVIRSIYRLKISKQNLLEWTTSEDAEKQAGTGVLAYIKCMKPNIILGLICILIGDVFTKIVGCIWFIAPLIACSISKEDRDKEKIKEEDIKYLSNIGQITWQFFKENLNEKNNFLPPDNYQEDRKEKVAYRTSPTNIGLRNAIRSFCL